jgi:hypothetical protein
MDTRFGTWNVKSLYREGSIGTVLKELSDLVGVQARWEVSSTDLVGEYTFFYGKGSENH